MDIKRSKKTKTKGAFTLVELLVVIAIIGILIALLLPAVQAAREAARRMQCSGNMKQTALALHNYASAVGTFPPGGITEGPCCSAKSGTNWAICILPYIEQQDLFDRYDQDAFNEDDINAPVRETRVSVYTCPSDLETDTLVEPDSHLMTGGMPIFYARGSYRACCGRSDGASAWWDVVQPTQQGSKFPLPPSWRGAFCAVGYNNYKEVAFRDISDGTSTTLMLGEHATTNPVGRRTVWARSFGPYNKSEVVADSRTLIGDVQTCYDLGGSWTCERMWGSFHPGGLQFAMCDGSVHWVSLDIDMNLLAEMATISGSEVITFQE